MTSRRMFSHFREGQSDPENRKVGMDDVSEPGGGGPCSGSPAAPGSRG